MYSIIYGMGTGLIGYVLMHRKPVKGDKAMLSGIALSAVMVYIGGLKFAAIFMLAHAISILSLTAVYRLSPWHPLAHVPGPIHFKIADFSFALVVISGRRHKIVRELHKQYGDFIRLGPNTVSINDRSAIGPIYSSTQCMDRSTAYNFPSFPGHGLFFILDRDGHNNRRNRWAPAFTSTNLQMFHDTLNQRTQQLAQCMRVRRNSAGIVNLSECIEHWSYDFMGDFAFGNSSELELMINGDPNGLVDAGKQSTALFDILGSLPWLYEILSTFGNPPSIKRLHKAASRMLEFRETRGSELQDGVVDISSCLLEYKVHDGGYMSREERILDAIFAIQAGSDTSANVLQYTFLFLIAHQEVMHKLQVELDEAFPCRDGPLDINILASLPYLNAVINEALRLGTPLSGLPRVTPETGVLLNNFYIPGNTIVSIPNYAQQLDPRNFSPRTEEFVPERWLDSGLGPGSILEPGCVLSFSHGPFGCLGRALAMQELRVVVACLALQFNLKFPSGFDYHSFYSNIRNIRTTFFPSPLSVVVGSRYVHE